MMKIKDIKALLENYFQPVVLVGSEDTVITGPAKIEDAGEGQVSFVANEKYFRFLEEARASLLIVHTDAPVRNGGDGRSFLKVRDPYTAFVFVLQKFAVKRQIAAPGISASALISPTARLGRNVTVGAYAVVGDRCVIGDGTVIGPHTVLMHDVAVGAACTIYPLVTCYDGTRLGNRVVVHSGTVIGADGFGFAPQPDGSYIKIPQMGIVQIEDDVEIGAHNCQIGENTVIASQAGISGSVKIGRGCIIGGQAGFAGHLEIADRTSVAAKAGISKSLTEPGQAIRGVPAQPMRDQLRQEALVRGLGAMKEKLEALESRLRELEEKQG